jgi:hypothetical protein
MISITENAVNSAFDYLERHDQYGHWFADSQAMLDLYEAADRAFGAQGNLHDFEIVYKELKGKWQVFRGGQGHWTLEQTYSIIQRLPGELRYRSLSQLDANDLAEVWAAIQSVRDIKRLKDGPSLVAISKFLHFWNPRLFVIFDSDVVECWVFRRKWLGQELDTEAVRTVLEQLGLEDDSRLVKYLRVLVFAREFVEHNACVLKIFRNRYSARFNDTICSYEALAVEWLLLGLVEIPPPGVEVRR